MAGLSLRALARELGVALSVVQKARDARRIFPEADGTWNLEKVRRQWAENTMASKRHRGNPRLEAPEPEAKGTPEGGNASWNRARTVREALQARLLELDLKARTGELGSNAEWQKVAKTQAKRTADLLASLPAQIGPQLDMVSGEEATRILETEIDRVLEDLAKYPPESTNGHKKRRGKA